MSAYHVADLAEADLDEIWEHLDEEASDVVADRQLDRLYERFQLLAGQRFLGRPRPEFALALRSFVVQPFIIFYYPRDSGITALR